MAKQVIFISMVIASVVYCYINQHKVSITPPADQGITPDMYTILH